MAGRLTTHVLDTMSGKPAAGVRITLDRIEGDGHLRLTERVTNHDGRVDSPLLADASMAKGIYELRFHAGDYFRGLGVTLPEPAFLDIVPIRFGIGDANAHYHVPLLIAPFAFSTYRGS